MTYMRFYLRLAVLTAASAMPLVMASSVSAAQPAAVQEGDMKAKADAIIKAAFPADGPGAAVIVTRGGRVVYSGGRGLADVEAGRQITQDTPFRLGSIAKQFTAATILQLVAEGKVSLDDPVSRFFPDWPKPGAGATVRQLLNHSSGLQDFSKIPGWISKNRQRTWTTGELLNVARDLPAKAEPGHKWEYNNTGYVVLGAIIEKVTGKAWHQTLEDRITTPLGLNTFAYTGSEKARRAVAKGYTVEGGRQQPIPPYDMSIAHAAGGLVGSVSDMARWAQALHHGRVVSPALYKEMTSPARLVDGSNQPYGFGLRLQEIRGRKMLVHGGAGGGIDTDSVYVPSEDVFVAVLGNSDRMATDPSILTRRLAALALGEPIPTFTPAQIDIAALEPLFGAYSAERGPPRRFFARNGKLYFGRGDEEREVFAAGEDRFFFGSDDLAWFRLERQTNGAHVMEVHAPEAAAPLRGVRTGPVPQALAMAPAVLQSYAGTYQTETLAVTVALDEKGGLTMTPAGQPRMSLRAVSDTEFRIDGTPMRVVFHPENGRVDRFTLYRGARELQGKRTGR